MLADPWQLSSKEVSVGKKQRFIGKLKMEDSDETFFFHCFWVQPVEEEKTTPHPWEPEL
jgi:hypothetical protein